MNKEHLVHFMAARGRGAMKRVVILGPGAAGKTTLAKQLGAITGLPVIELDAIFWRPDLTPTPRDEWVERQRELVEQERWIMDGDLGPYDALDLRLRAADTVIVLDVALLRCAWRAVRRSRERRDFWLWLLLYRWRSRPLIREAITTYAGDATIHILRDPDAIRHFLVAVTRASQAQRRSEGGVTCQEEAPSGEARSSGAQKSSSLLTRLAVGPSLSMPSERSECSPILGRTVAVTR